MSMRRTVAIVGAGLTTAAAVAAGTAYAATPAAPTTRILSVTTGGAAGNGHSEFPGVSRTGRFVTFRSTATNLIPRKPSDPPARDVFLYDRNTGKLEVVSVDTNGKRLPGHSGTSASPVTSDGKYVLFSSLVTRPGNPATQVFDVFLRTRGSGNGTTVDLTPNGDGDSFAEAISDDGRFVTYSSKATNLVKGDTNKASDVFLLDRKTNKTTRISVSSAHKQGDGASAESTISADGRYIAFVSLSTNLVPGDANGTYDVFLYDRTTHTTELVSRNTLGQQMPSRSDRPSISGDGRYIAFASETFGGTHVYLRDRVAKTTTLISHAATGPVGTGFSSSPSVSGNGRYVAFQTNDHTLLPLNVIDGVFVYDTTTKKLTAASVNNSGGFAIGPVFSPSVGDTGVAFQAISPNLGAPPSSNYQVYLRSF